jgi:hypothetical protein
MPRKNILALLAGGDRRSIGQTDHVAAMVAKNPNLFPNLIAGLWSEDSLIRMRSADSVEKVTRSRPDLLQPHKSELLGLLTQATEKEMRWHLAVMIPRLALTPKERQAVFSTLNRYLGDRSSIVGTFALQGLADLAFADASLHPAVLEILRQALRSGTPAMRARSRKLLILLEPHS